MASGLPPSAETLNKPVVEPNTIVPSRFQVPPEKPGASQISCGGPPEASTLRNLPATKYPLKRPSADQNGRVAFSVPASRRGVTEPVGRKNSADVSAA